MTRLLPVPHVYCDLPTPDVYVVELPQGLVALVDRRVEDAYLTKFGEYLQTALGLPGSVRPAPALSESEIRAIAAAAASISASLRREFTGGLSVVGREAPDPRARQAHDDTHDDTDPPVPAPIQQKGIRIDLDEARPPGLPGPVVEVRTDIAHTARVYDYLLGGKDNYMPDRDVGDGLKHNFPSIFEAVRGQRAFMHRSVRFIAEQGIDQFLDVGTGIPTSPNLHEIAQSVHPHAKVMYVDNDPIVLAHSTALMLGTPEGSVHYLEADARTPQVIIDHLRKLDSMVMDKPISVSTIGILHFLNDDVTAELIHTLMDAVPSGSYLSLSQGSGAAEGAGDEYYSGVVSAYREAGPRRRPARPGRPQAVSDPGP